MVKIGMMIGDRYEILEKIGTGGMSDVYKAKCHKLNRFVAVKVLKQEFSENANFVSKFRIEAQAAAGLMHPNIVNVYDVGEENGLHYIVMELVEGITLKKYIEKKARLSYKEAVSIAIQVCMGIEAAHNNHIIHRDIKPQNIIISKDGKVKVTDFGIAKAATSNTITSNVMGSVHYTSPEQARGGYSDEKSDIYSLGITLFEMLTGRVPFNGETTVAIAIKHIQEELPSPQDFVSETPDSVACIVKKCCQKSPDRRYQSMPELIADLKQSLMNPNGNFVVTHDIDEQAGTRMVPDGELSEIKRKAASGVQEDVSLRLNRTGRMAYTEYEEEPEEEDEEDDSEPKLEKLTTILAIVAGVVICIIIFVLLGKIFGLFSSNNPGSRIENSTAQESQTGPIVESSQEEKVEMIELEGWNVDEAKKKLIDMELVPRLTYEESDTVEENVVIRADIPEGTKLSKGTEVLLTVSSGSQGVEVPSAAGKSYEDAYSLFAEAGFKIDREEANSEDIEKGCVISQFPAAGESVPKGSSITVVVSIGPAENKVSMPNVIGMDEDEAVAVIAEAELYVANTTYVYNDVYAEGMVISQNYAHGTPLDAGTGVDIIVSKGKETITYWCNASIEAPSASEAPDYEYGTTVRITLVTDDGKTLLDTSTASFPQQTGSYYGIASPGGTITIYYTVTTEGTSTTDPETGETVVTPGETVEKSFTRRIEFQKE